MTTPRHRQLEAARRLASHHGHEWGGLSAETVVAIVDQAGDDTSEIAQLISEACTAEWQAWQDRYPPESRMDEGLRWVGIDAPAFDPDGDILHTTGTGRLEWLVTDTGRVFLEAYRATAEEGGGRILVAEATLVATPDGWYLSDADARPDARCMGRGVRMRHLDALRGAAGALGVEIPAGEVDELARQGEISDLEIVVRGLRQCLDQAEAIATRLGLDTSSLVDALASFEVPDA